MTTGLLLGCLLGLTVCGLAAAIRPPRSRLMSEAARWNRRRTRSAGQDMLAADSQGGDVRARMREAATWLGLRIPYSRADLAITERSLEQHMTLKVAMGLAGLTGPALCGVLVSIAGIRPGVAVPSLAALLLALVLFWLPDLWVVKAASERRQGLRRALACFLDLVSMSLAGGRGLPEALPSAARLGTGWAFDLLSRTIERARYTGSTPWESLADLGRRLDVPELVDLGASLQLVSDDGAKVRASLAARASTQRRRQLAETEGEAARADQSIEMAQVVLAIGFFLFLGFPAVVAVMGI